MKNRNVEEILDIFNGRKSKSIQNIKEAAVMILLESINDELYIVFQVRSRKLNHQPGDVCLPGGKVEKNETFKEAAIRETMEEMNLKEGDIDFIGEMDYFVSPYGMKIYPFISRLNVETINFNEDEVDHIFKVPISFFMKTEPLLYNMEIGPINQQGFPYHLIRTGENYIFSKGILEEYFYQWNNYVIWGFTAHIIKSFIDIIKH
ncbi:CoA pyrophosphatase [Clostridium sp.]|uniref:NUDIX hydrolase n=1 Tax=Clostridium sp. TaxID=1506 RepID=UPI003217D1DA